MFKPSPRLYGRIIRLPLTTKQTNKGYYKGSGTGVLGTINRKGKFKFDLNKLRTFVVPRELDTTKLTPFISRTDAQNLREDEDKWEPPLKTLGGPGYLEDFKDKGNHEEHLIMQEERARLRMLRGEEAEEVEEEQTQKAFELEKEWEKIPERPRSEQR